MSLPVLDDDVFYGILEELESQADISAFMRSSRSFYALGFSRLLRMGVSIHSDDKLVSFCCFMKRNVLDVPAHRADHLHDLTISIEPKWDEDEDERNSDDGDIEQEDGDDGDCEREVSNEDTPPDYRAIETLHGAPLLAPVLRRLTRLQRLKIEFCESLLECDEQLVDAFAAITTLRQLHISGFGLLTYDLVTNIRSHLSEVHVDCAYRVLNVPIEHYNGSGLPDPLHMLRRHRGTLEGAAVHLGDVTAWFLEQAPRTDASVFTRVRTLALSRCRVIERKVVKNAFPNINTLEVFWMEPGNVKTDSGDGLFPDEVRAINTFCPEQWAQLDFVYADIDSLFMLALKCTVGRLDVVCWEFDDVDVEYLCTVLPDVLPCHLVLQWGYWDVHGRLSPDNSPEHLGLLLAGLQEPVSSEITHFGLDVGLMSVKEEPFHYKDAISNLLAGLPHVRCFSFRLHAVAPEYEGGYDYATLADVDGYVFDVLAAFDDEQLAFWATQIAAVARSLEIVCFFVMSRRVFWRVAQGKGRLLQRVEPKEGEQLLAAEGMLWHCPSKSLWPGTPKYFLDD